MNVLKVLCSKCYEAEMNSDRSLKVGTKCVKKTREKRAFQEEQMSHIMISSNGLVF